MDKKENLILISERLRKMRKIKGYTQEEVAEFLEISSSGYGHYEIGKNIPTIEAIKKLSKLYNVSSDFLIGLDEEKTKYIETKIEKLNKENRKILELFIEFLLSIQ